MQVWGFCKVWEERGKIEGMYQIRGDGLGGKCEDGEGGVRRLEVRFRK